jgi:hypothetical protein
MGRMTDVFTEPMFASANLALDTIISDQANDGVSTTRTDLITIALKGTYGAANDWEQTINSLVRTALVSVFADYRVNPDQNEFLHALQAQQ